jgi:hypothetical protein
MAKPTITEKDLDAGISSLGGFGGLTKAGGTATRRDSPFGSSYAKPAITTPTREVVVAQKTSADSPGQKPKETPPTPITSRQDNSSPIRGTETTIQETKEDKVSPLSTTLITNQPPTITQLDPLETSSKTVPKVPKPKPSMAESTVASLDLNSTMSSLPKTQLFTERVTMVMDSETRDELNRLALVLQRRKSGSSERITANTLMRVAVKLFLNELKPLETETPNSEAELYQLTKARLKRRG